MEIERIKIRRDGDYYFCHLAVNGVPCSYQPCIFEFWELEEEFDDGSVIGSERFYQALAVKCLVSKVEEANYWIANGHPSLKAERDRAINLIGQLRQALLSEIHEAEAAGLSAAA
jgi:hypothetical protein